MHLPTIMLLFQGMASRTSVDELVEQPRPAEIVIEDTTDENLVRFKANNNELASMSDGAFGADRMKRILYYLS